MSDPIKPTDPSARVGDVEGVDAVDAVHKAAAVEASAAVDPTAAVDAAAPVGDPLHVAIREVADDIREGRVPDEWAASEAVILRLVNLRFAHLGEAQRRKMHLHLHEILHNDPQFQRRIRELIDVASSTAT